MAGFIAHAPCRVDLLGGTLDIVPLPALLGGATTVNAAITIRAEARVEPADTWVLEALDIGARHESAVIEAVADDPATSLLGTTAWHVAAQWALETESDPGEPPGCRLVTRSDAPPKSGLGGSSAMVIAMLAALHRFYGLKREPEALPPCAGDIEAHVLQAPTGLQDYYPAVFGGVAALDFSFGGLTRATADAAETDDFEAHLCVAYTGLSHASGALNWAVVKAMIDGDAGVRGRIERIQEVAFEGGAAAALADWPALGAALDADWAARKELGPGITTPECERMLGAARAAGAYGARLCGAGGGGCLVALVPPSRREAVRAALTTAGARLLDCGVDRTGLTVTPLPDVG